jgi:hypothetical protein
MPAPGRGAAIPRQPHMPGQPMPGQQPQHQPDQDDQNRQREQDQDRDRDAGDKAGEQRPQFTPEQLATPSPQLAGSRQMYIIVGPYKGSVLTMPDAEAEDAKDSHWAVEMSTVAPPFDADKPLHDHELTEEDRSHAVEAANTWAAAQNPQPEPPPPEGGARDNEPDVEGETDEARQARQRRNAEHNERQMQLQPDRGGDYETRGAQKPRR